MHDIDSKITSLAERGLLTGEAPENIRRWLKEDCYARYHDRIRTLLGGSDADAKQLNGMFWATIPFGTGGRRGIMGEMGPATINERTIAESAHGLAAYMKQQHGRETGKAVVAHDTRHNSHRFARITAATFAAHGLTVYVFGPHQRVRGLIDGDISMLTHRSTPLLSFAVRHLECDIGAMISASHNPPSDNGFKAYWNNGGQIVPPHDKHVVECVAACSEIPQMDYDQAVSDGLVIEVGHDVDGAFADAVLDMSLSDARDIKAVFTPLHGVGETSAFDVVEKAGFCGVSVYAPQREPHGDFPNVPDRFPNPERMEVFVPLIESLRDSDCELILATDPDADRVALSVRGSDGEFVNLTGNQIGALLCDYVLQKMKAAGSLTPEHYVVETLVTTPLTAAIARSYGAVAVTDLLVGFKWIARTIDERGPEKFVFATEESIGYLAGDYARDKDASVACLYALEFAAELKQQGQTLLDRLDELYHEHGVHAESQVSLYCHGSAGLAQIRQLMETIRTAPPESLAGLPLASSRDYATGQQRSMADDTVTAFDGPEGNLVVLRSGSEDLRLTVAARPSGTEPKIKFYFFVQADPAADLTRMRERADQALSEAAADLNAWAKNTLDA